MGQEKAFDIVVVGFDQSLWEKTTPSLSGLHAQRLTTAAEIESFLDGYQLSAGTYVLISNAIEGMGHLEVAQALNSYFQGIFITFVTTDRALFEVEKLKKNGFTDSFFLPLDLSNLSEMIEEVKRTRSGGAVKRYKAVKLLDVQPDEKLPFEVRMFLPMANKYVSLTGNGGISAQKMKSLKDKNVNSVFIDQNAIERFYEYTAEKLIASGKSSNDSVSETEKREKSKDMVRTLFRSVLDSTNNGGDFESGRDLLDQSKKVVSKYVEKKTGADLNAKFRELIGEGQDAYSHAQVVSTLACLLSMATEVGEPEDLAIAGLFHDIGIQGVQEEVSIFELAKLTPDEMKSYAQHPRLSLNLLKEKKITLSPKISEIVEKHHERMDGKGFPAALPAHKVPMEAQLLAYADAFEYLTRAVPGKKALSPKEAHEVIRKDLGLSNELLLKLERFLGSIGG